MAVPEPTTMEAVEPVRIETVIVTLDGSEESARAVPIGTTLAARLGARLRFLAVSVGTHDSYALRHDIEKFVGDLGDGPTDVVSASAAAPAILGAIGPVAGGVLCIASHGRNRSAAMVGSVTNEVAAGALAPLVVVGPRVEPGHALAGRLVACVDGSTLSETVLPVAASWATALELPLSIVTVAEPVPEPLTPGGRYHRMHGPDVDADRYVAELVDRWAHRGLDVDGRALYDPIDVTGAILAHAAARPTALVAATTHARRGPARVLLGSVAASIAHDGRAPVLLVPPHAAP